MTVRRVKPYVCIDVDFADHIRFQNTKDLDTAIGAWVRCLAHTRAQELDGLVPASWINRTFSDHVDRIQELISVGLLHRRDDGDYELHAYAPRNQTRTTMAQERKAARTRMRKWRSGVADLSATPGESDVTVTKRVTGVDVAPTEHATVTTNEHVPNASVPTSTSTSINRFVSSSLSSLKPDPMTLMPVPRAGADASARAERGALPASERLLSGAFWLAAFTEGIAEATGRPCTAGRFYLGTLERIVAHHAPDRKPSLACEWLKHQANAFASQWDRKHPAKGLTPDGLERWLNDGRQGPPEFGRPRIVQLSAEEWHEDDWSDLGAKVDP